MSNPRRFRVGGRTISVTGAVVALGFLTVLMVQAADHEEAPGTRADDAADIADVYAWHDAERNRLVAIVTFDGLAAPTRGQRARFDDDVLYTVNIDNNGDFVADKSIDVRFARQGRRWRAILDGMPGLDRTVVVPVNRRVHLGKGRKFFAGLRDDPFFFDLEGFNTTLQTGTLSFDGNRDSVAGLNASAIVLQMQIDDVVDGGNVLNIWATTARR